MSLRILSLIASLFMITNSQAMTLNLDLSDNRIQVSLTEINYPESLAQELKSGLSTNILIQIELRDNNIVFQKQDIHLSAKYDLWDENFVVQVTSANANVDSFVLPTLGLVLEQLYTITLPTIILPADLARESLSISVKLLLNPIDRERIKLLRKFVADNSVPGAVESAADNSEENQSLFRLIFEQYTNGIDVGAIWQTSATAAIP